VTNHLNVIFALAVLKNYNLRQPDEAKPMNSQAPRNQRHP
jgi:hypothetical protein